MKQDSRCIHELLAVGCALCKAKKAPSTLKADRPLSADERRALAALRAQRSKRPRPGKPSKKALVAAVDLAFARLRKEEQRRVWKAYNLGVEQNSRRVSERAREDRLAGIHIGPVTVQNVGRGSGSR